MNQNMTTDDWLAFLARATDLCVHPDDAPVLNATRHRLETNTLIGALMGPVRTARVVFLTLNPGSSGVEAAEAQRPEVREEMRRILGGDAPLPSFKTNPGGRVWTQRILTQFGVRYEAAADKVAFVNLVPYRSGGLDSKDRRLIPQLPTVKMVRRWTCDTLFPEARAGKRIVVCIVSHREWGFEPGTQQGISLFAPKCTRRQYILLHGPERENIGRLIRLAVYGEAA